VFYGDYYETEKQAKGGISWPILGVPEAFRTAR
jgi:hypothetical protein